MEQVVVQEEGVLAWGVLVSEREEQTGEEPAAAKMQTCHQSGNLLYAAFVTVFLLQNLQNHHRRRPRKIPLLLYPPQGFPDLKHILNQVGPGVVA